MVKPQAPAKPKPPRLTEAELAAKLAAHQAPLFAFIAGGKP